MKHCIDAFESLVKREQLTLTEGRAILEQETGRVITASVWSKWKRGLRTPPAVVLRIINRYIAADVLSRSGVNIPESATELDKVAEKVAVAFSPPPRIGEG